MREKSGVTAHCNSAGTSASASRETPAQFPPGAAPGLPFERDGCRRQRIVAVNAPRLRYELTMPRPLPPRGQILACLAAVTRPLHARDIADKLDVKEAQFPRLLDLLDSPCVEGVAIRRAGQRFALKPAADRQRERWTGVLSVNPRRFGFVVAAGRPDVYVAPDGIGAALHGDTVNVVVVNQTARGTEGKIESIQIRRNPRVAGTLHRRRNSQWLEPDDARLRGPIVLQPSEIQARDGVGAVAEITRFPESAEENPEGVLLTVLGPAGDPKVEVAKILTREQIEEDHPAAAIQEAESAAARLQRLSFQGRRDLPIFPCPLSTPRRHAITTMHCGSNASTTATEHMWQSQM